MIAIMSDAIQPLFEGGQSVALGAGARLFLAGDTVAAMYRVVEGRVDLVRHSEAGGRTVLNRATVGQVVAEASAYVGAYHCDGVAAERSRVVSVPLTVFRKRLAGDPALSVAWAESLAHALQEARMLSELRTLNGVAARLDAWLAQGREVPPKGQWQGLAEVLGVTREALYRELARRR